MYEGFVPAMIPKAWFDAEQKSRSERAKKRSGKVMNRTMEPRRVGSEYLLSGLVFCGHVDGEEHPMNIEHIPGEKGKRGSYTFFICSTSKNTRGTHCQAKRMGMKSLDRTVINNLLSHILTMDNLRPLAVEIARSLEQRSGDAGTRMIALEEKLAEVQKSLENIMDAIEKMGYASHLQQRYDARKREEEELLSEQAVLKALQISPRKIAQISDEALEGWIDYMRTALEGEDRSLARRIIHQFVAKIVIKEGTGTRYYTFPFPDDLYIDSYGDLDLKRLELLTSTVRL